MVFENFNFKDGLQSNEFNERSICESKDGKIYFGGVNGYTGFYPKQIQLDGIQPPVWITSLKVNEALRFNLLGKDRTAPIVLNYDQNFFSINFTGIDHLYPESVSYNYDLEGSSAKRIELGSSQQVNFTNLSPGKYVFCVRAKSKGGLVNQLGDSVEIFIEAPFWQSTWFYGLLLGFLAFLIWVAFYINYRIKMSKIQDIERIRKNVARDFHDELGSKLSIISMYSSLAKNGVKPPPDKMGLYLTKITNTSNSLYDSMRNLLWALNPEADTLSDLFFQLKDYGDELFSHSNIAFQSVGIPDELRKIELAMDVKRHLLLIFKEGMSNIMRHAECTEVKLNMMVVKRVLIMELMDNGKGFEVEEAYKGEGIKNIRNRAEKINARLFLQSDDSGTIIKLIFPLVK